MSKSLIMIVDDEHDVADSLKLDLQELEKYFIIVVEYSSYQALKSLEKKKQMGDNIVFFLIDQRMPEIEGTELVKDINKYYPYARKIMITGRATLKEKIQGKENGMITAIDKPWNKEELLLLVKHYLFDREDGYFPQLIPKIKRKEEWQWCPFVRDYSVEFMLNPNPMNTYTFKKIDNQTKTESIVAMSPCCSIYNIIKDNLVECRWLKSIGKVMLKDNTETVVCHWAYLLFSEGAERVF